MDITLPEGVHAADVPKCELGVKHALQAGRAVVIFFSSGGAFAAQLSHHWHAVVT